VSSGARGVVNYSLGGDGFMTLLKTGLLVALTAAAACASTITVTESLVTSGTLDGTAFTNQLVTVQLTGDTGSVTMSSSPVIFRLIVTGGTTVNVASVGADTFTDAMVAFSNQTVGFGGIADNTTGFVVIDNLNVGFGSYALNTSIGPLSGTSSGNPGTAFATKGGSLVLNGPFNIDHPSAFTAAVTTPEPGTLGLLGAGIGLVMMIKRMVR
jgi:hypothetical protein